MTTATQTFEGTAGAIPTAPAGTYGSFIWASTPAGTASDCALNAGQVYRGSLAGRCNSTTTGAYAYLGNGSPAASYQRFYLYLTAAPTGGFSITRWSGTGFAASHMVGIDASRRLFVCRNQTSNLHRTIAGTGADNYTSASNAVPLNQWFRVETFTSNTTVHAKLWLNPSSTGTPDYDSTALVGSSIGSDTLTVWPTAWNGSGVYSFLSSGEFLYMDGFALDTAGWVGPDIITHNDTGTVSAGFTFTADATASSPSNTAALDIPFNLTAEAVVTNTDTGTLDVGFTLTASASSTSDPDDTWGAPDTWGDLWSWWTTQPLGAIAPVGVEVEAESLVTHPDLAELDLAFSFTAETNIPGAASDSGSVAVPFAFTAQATSSSDQGQGGRVAWAPSSSGERVTHA